MHAQVCRQVSIESPGGDRRASSECVLSFEVPMPEVPAGGARIRVVCAGACYRMRDRSNSTSSSASAEDGAEGGVAFSQAHHGVRDGALFPGYEVAGVIDELGSEVRAADHQFAVGQRVVLYPYDGIPHGYAEFIVVPSLSYLVSVPDNLPLGVAAMLPTGALLAKNTVITAHRHVMKLLKDRPADRTVRILIVGTGGLALWALRIAEHHFKTPEYRDRVKITVATLKDEGLVLAADELKTVNIVQWNEDVYEKQLIERTKDACSGLVDIVIDFGTTSRSLHRSLQCLNSGGVVLVSEEVAERLLPKFSRLAAETNKKIEAVAPGSIEQLQQLVEYVAAGDIIPPPHSEFSADEAPTVVQKLCQSEIPDRVRCVEWCRKLAGLSDDDLEACKLKNEYAQLLRIQVRHNFLHGPFVKPPPETGKPSTLSECLGNLMAEQIPYLPRVGPVSPILHHKSPDGRAYISAKQIPGGGVFCYMAVSPDGLKCNEE